MDQWRGLELFKLGWRRARCCYYTRIQVNSKFWLNSPDLNHHDDDDDSGYCVFMHRHGDVSFDLKCFLKLEVNCKITRLDFGKWHVAATTLLTFVRWGDQISLLIWIEMNNLLHDGIIFLTELIFADAKNWLHRTATNSNTYTRIWRKVSAYYVWCYSCQRNGFCFGFSNYSSDVLFIISNSHSRCQDDYYWSYNPQNRHCYRVCKIFLKKNF